LSNDNGLRPGERTVAPPEKFDAGIIFIGRIRTPWRERARCPHRGSLDGPPCRIEIFDPWRDALRGVEDLPRLEVFYWLHESRRDLVLQTPLRSPVRPNPIGTSVVALDGIEDGTLLVRGLDCLDGTPLIDLKPERGARQTDAPAATTEATPGHAP
jgi:tRNA-Thr(GGU) m(6)t(6)A37 methyltransferase TsaA